MWKWLKDFFCSDYSKELLFGRRAGGKKETTKIIQPPSPPPAPTASEIAKEQAEAELRYTPEMARQYYELQKEYQPQLSELGLAIQEQLRPRELALQRYTYPLQSMVAEALSGQALQRLASPEYITSREEEALRARRERARTALSRGMRMRAELGGGLYGGRAELAERRGLTELEQAFAAEDIQRRIQAQQMAMAQAIPLMQQLTGTPITPLPIGVSQVTPSPETIYGGYLQRAMAQAPQVFYQTAQPSPAWGMTGQLGGGLLGGMTGLGGI